MKGGRAAERDPFVRAPQAEEFAEDLRGFGRGGEVFIEAGTRGVIAVTRIVQAHQHVERDRHGSVYADGLDDA
jgi:hypothetical protein